MAEKQVRLKALVRQVYGGRLLMPGDQFPESVSERTARGLIINHYAEEDVDIPTTKRTYRRRDMTAEK